MPHNIRVFRTGAVHHVTARTYCDELRLTPGDSVNLMVKSTLIRAARRCGVEVIICVAMGNHIEMLVMTPQDNLDAFMEEFLKELSHRLNRMRGKKHSNFPRRYDSDELGDEETVASRIVRILCNPVRARLVASADAWPGFSTLGAYRTGQTTLKSALPSRKDAERLRDEHYDAEWVATLPSVQTTLARPPIWPTLNDAQVRARICELVDAEEARLLEQIAEKNERVPGRGAILRERWDNRPDAVRWRARRRYSASDPAREAEYEAFYKATRRRYRVAAKLWRTKGEWGNYPPGTFPPGWLACLPTSADAGPPLPWTKRRRTGT